MPYDGHVLGMGRLEAGGLGGRGGDVLLGVRPSNHFVIDT